MKIADVFANSYGCMTTVMSFLTPLEQLKMQLLSIWWYSVAVARVQTRFKLLTMPLFERVYFFSQKGSQDRSVKLFEFNPKNKRLVCIAVTPNTKLSDDGQLRLNSGFSYTQTISGTICIVGGEILPKKCVKLVDFFRNGEFKPYFMQGTTFSRIFSSLCLLGEDNLVVTGSQPILREKKRDTAARKCEFYSTEQGWTALPDLNTGRSKHASCSIEAKIVFVFGGVTFSDQGESLTNTIERLYLNNLEKGWSSITIKQIAN